ncbi:helix-turn-helix domain-containing protein, partial [Gemmiger formicilis]|uniref:helix-turn-helix domain-containing protein n=1 Tax=Gemmiger formicilis TaxID=745368 RepID=UPI0019595C4A
SRHKRAALTLCRGIAGAAVVGWNAKGDGARMDQQKIARFLKQLRQESGLTQEQLAEQLGVNPRTVSRWETARTMPDFALLVELGRRYGVTADELLDGERRAQSTEKEETAMEKIAEYTWQEKQALTRRFHRLFWAAGLLLAVAIALQLAELTDRFPCNFLSGLGQGAALGMLLVGALFTSRYGVRIRACKQALIRRFLHRA